MLSMSRVGLEIIFVATRCRNANGYGTNIGAIYEVCSRINWLPCLQPGAYAN
jgi:hypothetical protein